MHDIADHDKFRGLLLEDPIQLDDRVDEPWYSVPDYPTFNRRAFHLIKQDIQLLKGETSADAPFRTRGVLIVGEAGAGKTHLLTRVAQALSGENTILFVRRPSNEEAVALHIWQNIVESLSRKLAGSERSQIDNLLVRVFSRILVSELEQRRETDQKRRWVELLSEDPENITTILGTGEVRTNNLDFVRRRILGHLTRQHREVAPKIARALITYCLVADDNRKRILQTWLAGQDVEEAEAKQLGLPPWCEADESSTRASVWQAREQQSLKAIQTLGILSTYDHPLILAFDQLEGLSDEPETLTRRWGDKVREIFTMAPNLLVVTCVLPSSWNDWFTKVLDPSAIDRIAQTSVELQSYTANDASRILASRLEKHLVKHRLPTEIYPFSFEVVERLHSENRSPRRFLQAARKWLSNWLFDEEGLDSESGITKDNRLQILTGDTLYETLRQRTSEYENAQWNRFNAGIPLEEEFFARTRAILQLITKCQPSPAAATLGTRVMPFNLFWSTNASSTPWCISVCHNSGVAFSSRVNNLLEARRQSSEPFQIVLLRDERCPGLTRTGKEALANLEELGGLFIEVEREEYAVLNGIFDTLLAIEQQDVSVGSITIDKSAYGEFLCNADILQRSQLYRAITGLSGSPAMPSAEETLVCRPVKEMSTLGATGPTEDYASSQCAGHSHSGEFEHATAVMEFPVDCSHLDQGEPNLDPEPADSAARSTMRLIASGETMRCEFKSTLRMNLYTKKNDKEIEHACLKTIAAFLNTHGGHLIVGVDDSGEVLGLENDRFRSEDNMNLHLVNLLRDRLGAEHSVRVVPSFETIDGKRVLVVECSPSKLPVFLKWEKTDQFFVRTGAATTELRPSKIQGYLKQRF